MGPDGAGVEQDDVGRSGVVDELVALSAQTTDDELAIEHVHLTADGFDEEGFGAVVHVEFRGTGYKPGPGQRVSIVRFKFQAVGIPVGRADCNGGSALP